MQARGELQLGVLIENMRREGLELSVSPPRVLIKCVDGGLVGLEEGREYNTGRARPQGVSGYYVVIFLCAFRDDENGTSEPMEEVMCEVRCALGACLTTRRCTCNIFIVYVYGYTSSVFFMQEQVYDAVSGSIIEALSVRKGELREMVTLQVNIRE